MEEKSIQQHQQRMEDLSAHQLEDERNQFAPMAKLASEDNLKPVDSKLMNFELPTSQNVFERFKYKLAQSERFPHHQVQDIRFDQGQQLTQASFPIQALERTSNTIIMKDESPYMSQQQAQELLKAWNEVSARNAKLEVERALLFTQLQQENEKLSVLEAIGKVSNGIAGFIESFNIFYQGLLGQKAFEDDLETNSEQELIHDILINGEAKIQKIKNFIDKLLSQTHIAQQLPEDQEQYAILIRDINENNTELRAELEEKTKDIQELVNYSTSLRNRILELENEKSEVLQTRARSSESMVHKSTTNENERMVQVFELLDGTLEVTLTQEEVRNLSVSEKFTEIKNIISQHEELKLHYRNLQEENDYLEVTLESITNKLKAQQAEIEFLNRQIDNTREEFSEFLKMDELLQFENLKREKDGLKNSNQELLRENADLRNKTQRLTEDLNALSTISKNQREEAPISSEGELKLLLEKNRQLSERVFELTRTLEHKSVELVRIERERKEVNFNNQELTRKTEGMQRLIETMKGEADKRDKTINDLIQQVSELIQTNDGLKQQLGSERSIRVVSQTHLNESDMIRKGPENKKEAFDKIQQLKKRMRSLADLLNVAYDEEDQEEKILSISQLELRTVQSNYEKLKNLTSKIVLKKGADWNELKAELIIHGIEIPKENDHTLFKGMESKKSALVQKTNSQLYSIPEGNETDSKNFQREVIFSAPTVKLGEKEELFNELSFLNNMKLQSTLGDKFRQIEKLKEILSKYFKRPNSSIVQSLEAVFEVIAELKSKLADSERLLEDVSKHRSTELGELTPGLKNSHLKTDKKMPTDNLSLKPVHTKQGFEKVSEPLKLNTEHSSDLLEKIMATIDDELNALRGDRSSTMIKAVSILEKLKELIGSFRGSKQKDKKSYQASTLIENDQNESRIPFGTQKNHSELSETIKTPERFVNTLQGGNIPETSAELSKRYKAHDLSANNQESNAKYHETLSPKHRFNNESNEKIASIQREIWSNDLYQINEEVKYNHSTNKPLPVQQTLETYEAVSPYKNKQNKLFDGIPGTILRENASAINQKYSSLQKSPVSDYELATPIRNESSSRTNPPRNTLAEKPLISNENTQIEPRNLPTAEKSLNAAVRTTANAHAWTNNEARPLTASSSVDYLLPSQIDSAKNVLENGYDRFFSSRPNSTAGIGRKMTALELKPELLKENIPNNKTVEDFVGKGKNKSFLEMPGGKHISSASSIEEINLKKKKIQDAKLNYMQEKSKDFEAKNLIDLQNSNEFKDRTRLKSLATSIQFIKKSPSNKMQKDNDFLNSIFKTSPKHGLFTKDAISSKFSPVEAIHARTESSNILIANKGNSITPRLGLKVEIAHKTQPRDFTYSPSPKFNKHQLSIFQKKDKGLNLQETQHLSKGEFSVSGRADRHQVGNIRSPTNEDILYRTSYFLHSIQNLKEYVRSVKDGNDVS